MFQQTEINIKFIKNSYMWRLADYLSMRDYES